MMFSSAKGRVGVKAKSYQHSTMEKERVCRCDKRRLHLFLPLGVNWEIAVGKQDKVALAWRSTMNLTVINT
jgi:hypothetical protein